MTRKFLFYRMFGVVALFCLLLPLSSIPSAHGQAGVTAGAISPAAVASLGAGSSEATPGPAQTAASPVIATEPTTSTVFLPLTMRNAGPCFPVWADAFGNDNSGWPIEDNAAVRYAYLDGEYQILAKAVDAYTWARPGVQMVDGLIAVDVRFGYPGDGSDNGGILFGQQAAEPENFCRFSLARNGGYCIQRHVAQSGWDNLICGAAPGYQPFPASNHMELLRHGEGITAYLNGEYVATVFDGHNLGNLHVGLSAGTAVGNADLRFDDYLVLPLQGCIDTAAPQVTSTDPSDGATGVGRALQTVSVTFNESMDPARWSSIWGGMGDFDGSYEASTHTFVFTRTTPGLLDANRTYTVTLNPAGYDLGYVDLWGNPAPTSTFSFTTGE